MQGPQHPLRSSFNRNTLLGHVESHVMDEFQFHNQYHTFETFGYANDPKAVWAGVDSMFSINLLYHDSFSDFYYSFSLS